MCCLFRLACFPQIGADKKRGWTQIKEWNADRADWADSTDFVSLGVQSTSIIFGLSPNFKVLWTSSSGLKGKSLARGLRGSHGFCLTWSSKHFPNFSLIFHLQSALDFKQRVKGKKFGTRSTRITRI
jgi:hypothetical protein